MCQLLGMNCATPTDFSFSFRGFAKRGGETDKHEHGWGLAVYEGRGLRVFLDSLPASKSPVAELVEHYPMKTLNMMAHIRYATQGGVNLENVHPFQREMWGIQWSFAHNGEVPKYSNKEYKDYPLLGGTTDRRQIFYHPVGDTDSEATFCAILNGLRAEFTSLPTLPVLYESIQRFCSEIVSGQEDTTIFNFLLGCGQYTLFAYSWPGARPGSKVWNGLFYTIRRPPFSTAKLSDVDYAVDFTKVTTPKDRVAVIATCPLTVNEEWTEFKRGQLLMFDNGHPYSELYDCEEVEQKGHGLSSRAMAKDVSTSCIESRQKYHTPTLLRELLNEAVLGSNHKDETWAEMGADLGCGSGLSGLAFRSCIQYMIGVDISPEMVHKAEERGCYDSLVVGDAECILQINNELVVDAGAGACEQERSRTENKAFDLIFACDVLVYIGDLQPIFISVRNALLEKKGYFAFSAEIPEEEEGGGDSSTKEDDQPFVLQSCARFAHAQSYIDTLIRKFNFEIMASNTYRVRKQVKGLLLVLKLSA